MWGADFSGNWAMGKVEKFMLIISGGTNLEEKSGSFDSSFDGFIRCTGRRKKCLNLIIFIAASSD